MLSNYVIKKNCPLNYRYFLIEDESEPFITTLDICDDFDTNLFVFIKKPDCENRMLRVEDIGEKVKDVLESYGQVTKNIVFFTYLKNRSTFDLFEFIPDRVSQYTKLRNEVNLQTLSFSEIDTLRSHVAE